MARHVSRLDRWLGYPGRKAFENAQAQFERDRAAQMGVGSQNLQDLPKNYTTANLISSLSTNSQCEQVVCEIHPTKEVEFYCETCQCFACSTCTGVKCKQHTVLELPDVDDKFKTELKATLKPIQALSSNLP